MLNALAGRDESDVTALDVPTEDYTAGLTGDLTGITIGVDIHAGRPSADSVDPAVDGLLQDAIAVLKGRGANVVDVSLPLYDEGTLALTAIMAGERAAFHMPDAQSQLQNYTAGFRHALGVTTFFSAADYVQAQRVRRVIVKAVNNEVFAKVDLVLTPTTWTAATPLQPLMDEPWKPRLSINTRYWDLTGHPAIAVPMGFNAEGLPMSLQLSGRPFAEGTVLRAAHAFQRDTDFHRAVPPIAHS